MPPFSLVIQPYFNLKQIIILRHWQHSTHGMKRSSSFTNSPSTVRTNGGSLGPVDAGLFYGFVGMVQGHRVGLAPDLRVDVGVTVVFTAGFTSSPDPQVSGGGGVLFYYFVANV